ncbi:hypothetical protein ACFL0M_10050 [Thermodesulfobacteriota bacterium]
MAQIITLNFRKSARVTKPSDSKAKVFRFPLLYRIDHNEYPEPGSPGWRGIYTPQDP